MKYGEINDVLKIILTWKLSAPSHKSGSVSGLVRAARQVVVLQNATPENGSSELPGIVRIFQPWLLAISIESIVIDLFKLFTWALVSTKRRSRSRMPPTWQVTSMEKGTFLGLQNSVVLRRQACHVTFL